MIACTVCQVVKEDEEFSSCNIFNVKTKTLRRGGRGTCNRCHYLKYSKTPMAQKIKTLERIDLAKEHKKRCSICDEIKNIDEFYGDRQPCRECKDKLSVENRNENLERYQEYYRNYFQKVQKQQRKEFLAELKEWYRNLKGNTPCKDCKVQFPQECMEFDHVKGKKLFNVSHLIISTVSFERLLEEIEKCEIVCSNCHKKRTFKRLQDRKGI